MIQAVHQIPFLIDDVYGGFARIEGILSAGRNAIGIEFQTKDNIMKVVKSKSKEVTIPYQDIAFVKYKRNMFISRLRIRVNKMGRLDDFPHSDQGEVVLKIKRRDKELIKNLESYVNLRISEIRLDLMEGPL